MSNNVSHQRGDLIPENMQPQRDSGYDDREIDLDFSQVDSLNRVTMHLLWNQYLLSTIIVSVCALAIVSLSLYFFEPQITISSVIAAFILVSLHIGRIRKKSAEWFMKKFAEYNDLDYVGDIFPEELTGGLFQRGYKRKATNAVITEINGHPLKLFYYQYSIKRGRHSVTYKFTVLEIGFEKTLFPHIHLHAQSKRERYSRSQANEEEVPLENEFANHYRLFVRDGYQTEVLQIFDHDTLRFLIKEAPDMSIEFAENKMYIYREKTVTNRQELQTIFQTGEDIIHRMGPLLNRLENDFAVLHRYYR